MHSEGVYFCTANFIAKIFPQITVKLVPISWYRVNLF